MKAYRLLLPLFIFLTSLFALPDLVQAATARKRGGRSAFAGGSISMGLGVSLLSAEQNGLNQMITAAKATSGASTSELGSGVEYMGFATFRFSNGYVALQLRPAYFTQSVSGSGTGGAYDYNLTGFSVFPLVRIIPLSNDIIDFYLQGGIGYGSLNGDVTNGARNVSFKGSSFGIQIGLGADFCLVPEHCFGIEGNYRYLPVERNIVKSISSTMPDGVRPGTVAGNELEDTASGNDIGTTMSGVAGILTYTFNF